METSARLLYILLRCVPTLSYIFQTLKTREISNFIRGNAVFHLVTCL